MNPVADLSPNDEAEPSNSGSPRAPHREAVVAANKPAPSRRRKPKQCAEGPKLIRVKQDEVQSVMSRYRTLQQESHNQHDGKAPQLLAENQALLAEKLQALGQARRQQTAQQAQQAAAGTPAATGNAVGDTLQPLVGPISVSAPLNVAGNPAADGYSSSEGQSAGASESEEDVAGAGRAGVPASAIEKREQLQPYYATYYVKDKGQGDLQELATVQAIRLDAVPKPPEFYSWSKLQRNQLAPELPPGTKMYYPDIDGETIPTKNPDTERKPWFRKSGPSHDYALKLIAEEYADRLPWLCEAVATGINQDAEDSDIDVAAVDVAERLQHLWAQELKSPAPTEQQRRRVPLMETVDEYWQGYCIRCRQFDCAVHGLPSTKLRKIPQRQAAVPSTPCGRNCWMQDAELSPAAARSTGQAAAEAAAAAAAEGSMQRYQEQQRQQLQYSSKDDASAAPELSPLEASILEQGISMFGPDPCQLAGLPVGKTCREVKQWLMQRGTDTGQDDDDIEATVAAKRRKRKGAKPSAARKAVQQLRWKHRVTRLCYQPCNCTGPCKRGSCSCIDNANFCEKFCACASCTGKRDCTFKGCNCRGGCKVDSCPCGKADRECDPLLCGSNCAATAAGTAPGDGCCGNMNLRLRKNKRVQIGWSAIAGLGCYIKEPAKAGEFIAEYVGELLTNDEAEKRGAAYDKSDNSYLFTINNEWVVDARQRGNELRFANHKHEPNCRTRVTMVDGDHRVGLYALEDLEPDEELFYNYMYAMNNAPDWAVAG